MEVDKKKARYYYELAAMGGEVDARYNLGVIELQAGNYNKARKHFMIAVRDGGSNSLGAIKMMYRKGDATKNEYTKALESYQVYLDEIKSDQRNKAAAAHENCKYFE